MHSTSPPRQHKVPTMTPQMSVLGRNGRDLESGRNQEQLLESGANGNRSRPWWRNLKTQLRLATAATTTASGSSANRYTRASSQTDYYSAAEEEMESGRAASVPHQHRAISIGGGDEAYYIASTDDDTPTNEELVSQDCGFFYQDLKTAAPSLTNQVVLDQVPPPRYRAAYRAKFQQLNQVYVGTRDRHDDDWDYEEPATDLELFSDESSGVAVQRSSMCWYQNGRILCRLPKDKVRLLMDPHLEPGILSIDGTTARVENSAEEKENDDDSSEQQQQHRSAKHQEITYVLTVDDHLYKRVVAELSDGLSSPCGCHLFCTDEGNLSIQVAVLVLVVVLSILLIVTIIYPGD